MEAEQAVQQLGNVQPAVASPSSNGGHLTKQQKRLRRQKLAKLFKRVAVQESSHSEAAEDHALQQAYEQHLRGLQQQHAASPGGRQQQAQRRPAAGRGANKRRRQGGEQQQQQQGQASPSSGGKRRRRSAGHPGPAAGSVDTLASSALAASSAQPAQPQAQMSDLSANGTQRQEGPAPAVLLVQAMQQRQQGEVVEEAAPKAAGVCRLDLSAAALLIGSRLAPGTAQQGGAAGQADSTQDGAAAEQEGEVEDATEGAAAGGAAAKRQRRHTAVHGNYHQYYGYRFHGDEQPQDPRLAVFERKWFARRRCLDVGCNEGLITLALATRFHPRSMLGVDIDAALIARASGHLRDARSSAVQRAQLAQRAGVPVEERREAKAAAATLAQTLFVHTDFLDSDVQPASLDTITCLSVTKWVHLNRGDAGLRALFAAFWRALVPGGLLLLEPQPWRSYKAAACKVSRQLAPPGSFFHRQHELQLRPAQFADHLCGELGFRLVKRLSVSESAAGFDRPLLLLHKPTS